MKSGKENLNVREEKRVKKILSVMLVFALILSLTGVASLTAQAETLYQSGHYLYRFIDDGEAVLIGGYLSDGETDAVIPSTIHDKPVTTIDTSFQSDTLQSITIPASVVSITERIFLGCGALQSITVESGNPVYHSDGNCLIETASKTLIAGCKASVIPTDGSVTTIGEAAFEGCVLTSITLPDGLVSIGPGAFYGCRALTEITFPDGLTSIGNSAFGICDALQSLTIPKGVTFIGDQAFAGCINLREMK